MDTRQDNRTSTGDTTMEGFEHNTGHDLGNDASLLEGLFQLVVTGHTDGWEFEQLDAVVYQRLQDAYPVPH